MPAAVTYIGLQIGGTIGAALIMNSVVVANLLLIAATPALSRATRRSVTRNPARRQA